MAGERKKITELDACFLSSGGHGLMDNSGREIPRRERVALSMLCPCGCKRIMIVPFENPDDGKGPFELNEVPKKFRTGDTLETLSLTPSIQRHKINGEGCEWHGYITNGEAITC